MNIIKSLLKIEPRKSLPVHVVVIPDGNRRWAKERGLKGIEGHRKSAQYENILRLLEEAERLGVKYLSFWAFSTENWRRDKAEVNFLFKLLDKILDNFLYELVKRKVRFRHLGRKDRLPKQLVSKLAALEKKTENFNKLNVQLCLDYGGRDEIVRAINKMINEGVKKVDEKSIKRYLDTYDIPDPDLVIRTSGEHRTSGFMAFQSVYAELYFTNIKFPDFGPEDLRSAIEEFSRRKRNFGK